MTPLDHIQAYLREEKILGFFSVALLAPVRGSTLFRPDVEAKSVDPNFDYPEDSPKIKKISVKEKKEKRESFEPLIKEGTKSGFSFTSLFAMAARRIPIAIFDKKTYEHDPRCSPETNANIFTYFLDRTQLTVDDDRYMDLWTKLRRELQIKDFSFPDDDVVKNFNNILVRPRSELLQQCVLLLPVISPKNPTEDENKSSTRRKITRGDIEEAFARGPASGVAGRFIGLLNVTCRLPSHFSSTTELIRKLEVPQLLATSRLVRRFMNSYDEAIAAAARAAVFARNFSHVIGSHVISNPDFREALVRPATIGGRLQSAEGTKPILDNLRIFHEYLQGRFDFIARAIDESHDQPEPVYFVMDLLEGFLKQSAFLDTFVADLGVHLSDMIITVRLPGDGTGQTVEFETSWKNWDGGEKANPERKFWVSRNTEKTITVYDQLVGIPGGMVSAHAFYSILENIMRNSVKYGEERRSSSKRDEPYRLILALENADPDAHTWRLQIHDNYSTVNRKELDDIRRRIELNFVHPNGSARRDSLGLLEMQACASGLFRSPVEFQTESGSHGNLRAISAIESAPSERSATLVYELDLNMPILLAVVGKKDAAHRSDLVRYFTTLDQLTESGRGAHIVAIDIDKWPQNLDHRLLPYRVIVFDNDLIRRSNLPNRRVMVVNDSSLRTRLFSTTGPARPVEAPDNNSEHALILDCYEAWLRQWKSDGQPDRCWDLWIGMERVGAQIQETWEAPLRQFSQRYASAASSTGTHEGRRKKPFINIAIRSHHAASVDAQTGILFTAGHPCESESEQGGYWERELHANRCDKRALVFDNHGKCFESIEAQKTADYRRATRFYQVVSGTQTPELFWVLSHPPSSPFAFAFHIFSLVEACLANVVIVDERIAADLLFSSHGTSVKRPVFISSLGEHHKSGVFPVFCFGRTESSPTHYTPAHEFAITAHLGHTVEPSDAIHPLLHEGIRFNTGTTTTSSLRLLARKEWNDGGFFEQRYDLIEAAAAGNDPPDNLRCDAIVIHEGVLDLIGKQIAWPTPPEQQHAIIQALWKLSPVVVRTSGRGRHTKHFPFEIPFVEFSEISSSLLTARNKLALVRSLFGASGEKHSPT